MLVGSGKPKASNFGFTLIELMVCISVMALLGMVAYPCYHQSLTRAKLAKMHGNVHAISHAYRDFILQTELIPEKCKTPTYSYGSNVVIPITADPHCSYFFFRHTLSRELDEDYFIDPFFDYEQTGYHLLAIKKNDLNQIFPFHEGNRQGVVMIGKGPDGRIEKLSSIFSYGGMVYSVTNGLHSNGDVFINVPENTVPRFISTHQ